MSICVCAHARTHAQRVPPTHTCNDVQEMCRQEILGLEPFLEEKQSSDRVWI